MTFLWLELTLRVDAYSSILKSPRTIVEYGLLGYKTYHIVSYMVTYQVTMVNPYSLPYGNPGGWITKHKSDNNQSFVT